MKKLGTLLLMSSLTLQSLTYAVTPQQPPMKVLYENDFESPKGECGFGTFSTVYDTTDYIYYQRGSADCFDVAKSYSDDRKYLDTTGKTKKYFGGITNSEAYGLLFPYQNYEYINIELDQSLVAWLTKISHYDKLTIPNEDKKVNFSFYKIQKGKNFDLYVNNTNSNPRLVKIDNVIQTPFYTQNTIVPKNSGLENELNYKNFSISVPLKKVNPDEKILMVSSLLSQKPSYVAFDNLRITTADYSITSYTIKHHLEQPDGTYKVVDTDTISESGKVGTPITTDVRSYTGYTYDKTLSTQSGTLEEKKELSLNMYYTLNHYPLTYDANTGTGTMESETHTGTATIALTPNAFTKKDHAFIGRTTTPELTGALYENATGFTMPLTGVNLYAQRKQVVFHGIGMDIKKKKIQKNDCEFGTGSIEDVTIKTIKAATGSTRELANEKAQRLATVAAMRTRKVRGQKLANAQGTCMSILNPPAQKTPVANLTKLTDEEKEKVTKAIKDANTNAPIKTIEVADDGTATVTYTDGTTATLEPEKTVEQDPTKKDTDGDGVPDKDDAFPTDPTETTDTDDDGIGNNADTDDDNDGVLDEKDAFPKNPKESIDTDDDGIGNNADTDDDNDGFTDEEEQKAGSDPLNPKSTPKDIDGDGIPNDLDTDTDGDGISDEDEMLAGLDSKKADTDGDGILDGDEDTDGDGKKNSDESDPLLATSRDTDKDGTPDIIDADDNTPIIAPVIPTLPHTGAEW